MYSKPISSLINVNIDGDIPISQQPKQNISYWRQHMLNSSGTCSKSMSWTGGREFPVPKSWRRCRSHQGATNTFLLSPTTFHGTMHAVPRMRIAHSNSSPASGKFFFPLKWLFFSPPIHFYFIFFIYFSSVSFSIWKVTWPLFPPSIFLLPLFSLGMKHRTRLKAFNGHSIGEEKSPSELY